jgi:hypothetical protein
MAMNELEKRQLLERLERLEEELRHQRGQRRRGQIYLGAVLTAALVLFAAAEAASAVDCTDPGNTLLCSFSAGTPAKASEVNSNFTKLQKWIQEKVGTVGTKNVDITGNVSIKGTEFELTFDADSDNVAIRGGNKIHGNLHLESILAGDVFSNHS